MAEKTTIARPYAEAAFELALAGKRLKEWSHTLQFAAHVVVDPQMDRIIDNPRFTKAQVVELMTSVCGDALDSHGRNFIALLAENGRLSFLPEISALFEIARAEAEGTVEAQVTSAATLTASQQQAIAQSLKKKLGREVTLSCQVDESLIGGAVIRAGDLVIDGSVAGKLARLESRLLS